MRIPNGAFIMVTDGRKRLVLRNCGDSDFPQFVEVAKAEADNPWDLSQSSDGPRHAASPIGRRAAYDGADVHAKGEVRFAREAAAFLNRHSKDGFIPAFVIAADRKSLGIIRKELDSSAKKKLIGVIGKDLSKHPIKAIEQALLRA